MIIGNGLIANSLKNIDSEDIVFFASGVSNSLETRKSEFEREFTLLKNTLESNRDSKLIYFSTLSINDQSKQNSHYVLHKKEIENYIQKYSKNYLILRVGNIVGKGGNPNTLFNYLKAQISNNNKFVLHTKARRLLIDIDDIALFLDMNCAQLKNKTINFAYPYYYDLTEIINAIQIKMDKKANYDEVNEGDFYKVTFDENINNFFSKKTSEDYIISLTEKYI
ncbi:NAD-dependent epimerase/dehydratase family protein [Chryseobacterium sp. G0201]|uniref:NAD-dependent epimerase/dehydratase family protein n=1 Tax=Chryseobacterium sp. G0201 TaxID=2487065 RepID=UPI000F4E72D3|nr:NAD-dependent epimerase/dehydratase family protein [Chryseobacterium sp. G0201]AZA53045.1 NAD(P)-dependent oxidoreductase [Chryseobacterium sp. G0201]